MKSRRMYVLTVLALGACVKSPLPADSASTVTMLGIEVKASEEVRRAGPQTALPVPGTVALFVQIKRPAYLSLARKSGTSAPALLSTSDAPVLYPASSEPVRFPPAGQWLHIGDLNDGDLLCLSAHDQPTSPPGDLCGSASILLHWSRDKGETHPQPQPPAPETKAPSSSPPPPPPTRTEGSRG